MTKLILLWLLLMAIVFGASGLIVNYVFARDVENANEACAKLGAVPYYTYRTRYICLMPDGRVVE